MKKRLVLSWMALVMVLTLALAAPTAATTGFTFTIVDQHCYGAQGQNVYFRVKLTAAGSTSANKLTIKSQSQYFSGGKWHKFYSFTQDKTSFTPNGQAHSIDYSYTSRGHQSVQLAHRVQAARLERNPRARAQDPQESRLLIS